MKKAGFWVLGWGVAALGMAAEAPPSGNAEDEIVAIVAADVPGFIERVSASEPFADDVFKGSVARQAREFRSAEPITRRDLALGVYGLLQGDDAPLSPPEDQARLRKAQRKVLDLLIEKKILARAAREQGFEISDREVDDEIVSRLRRNPEWGVRDIQEFARRLAKERDSLERYRREIRESLLASYYEQYNVKTLEVSPERIAAYYRDHPGEFVRPAAVRLRRILLAASGDTAARAQECARRARAGEDPAALVKEFSVDLETRESGGLADWIEKGSYPEPIEALAYAAEKGAWQGPVEAQGFLWIFRTEESRLEEVLSLAEAQKTIRAHLLHEENRARLRALMERTRKAVLVWESPAVAPE